MGTSVASFRYEFGGPRVEARRGVIEAQGCGQECDRQPAKGWQAVGCGTAGHEQAQQAVAGARHGCTLGRPGYTMGAC